AGGAGVDLLVRGIGDRTALVARHRALHALGVAEHRLDAPEAPAGKNRGLEALAFLRLALGCGRVEDALGGSGRGTSGQRHRAGREEGSEALQAPWAIVTARIVAVTPKPMKKERKRSGLNRPMGIFRVGLVWCHRPYPTRNYDAVNPSSPSVHI